MWPENAVIRQSYNHTGEVNLEESQLLPVFQQDDHVSVLETFVYALSNFNS